MDNPCYDKQTKKDCPNRTSDCALTCPKWQNYLELRNGKYEEQYKNRHLQSLAYIKHKPPRKRY